MDMLTIPEKKHIPDTGSLPSHINKSPNWADSEETVKKVLEWTQQYYEDFEGQASRDKMIKNMDTADELTRAAITATQLEADVNTNGQKIDNTKTNVTTASYYRYLRAVTAWETNVGLGNEQELPVKAEPIPGAHGAKEDEAMTQAETRNMELAYAFEHGQFRPALADNQWALNKYGNRMLEIRWRREEEEITERVPVRNPLMKLGRTLAGKPLWQWKKSKKVMADWPELVSIDLRNAWFDMTVSDIQKQSCVILRSQHQYADLLDFQLAGWAMNMENVTAQTQYNADATASDQAGRVLDSRKTNADESGDEYNITKLFDIYKTYIRVPVDSKGKWDEKKVVARWHEAWFVGDLKSQNVVCIRLSPLIYNKGELPLLLQHAIRDDKGAISVGYAELSKCLLAMEMTVFNQAFDNWKTRNRQPILAEKGSLLVKELNFTPGGNRIVYYQPGAQQPTELKIGDTTGTMPLMLQEVDRRIQDVFGVNKPFMSQALGGRTSAQEALFVTDQAIKIALEEAKYKWGQVLTFVAEWTLSMMDQFADPDIQRFVMWGNKPVEVKPQEAWMPVNLRVVSVKQFQDSAIRRREEDQFINQIFPLAKEVMSKQGQVNFFTQVAKNRGFENVDEWWSQEADYDAREEAKKENVDILWYGINDLPAQEENHPAHLLEHKPSLSSYILLPENEQIPDNIRKMKQHIQMHERFSEQAKSASANRAVGGAQPMQEAPAMPTPGTPGQEGGEAIAAEMGSMGNMPAPETEETGGLA